MSPGEGRAARIRSGGSLLAFILDVSRPLLSEAFLRAVVEYAREGIGIHTTTHSYALQQRGEEDGVCGLDAVDTHDLAPKEGRRRLLRTTAVLLHCVSEKRRAFRR